MRKITRLTTGLIFGTALWLWITGNGTSCFAAGTFETQPALLEESMPSNEDEALENEAGIKAGENESSETDGESNASEEEYDEAENETSETESEFSGAEDESTAAEDEFHETEIELSETEGKTSGNAADSGQDETMTALMPVTIEDDEGMKLLVKDGSILYTARPLTFYPGKYSENNTYYSLSTDGGKSFGGYVLMEEDSVTLYPDVKNDIECFAIRFRTESRDQSFNSEGSMPMPADIVSKVYRVQFDMKMPKISVDDPEILNDYLRAPGVLSFTADDEDGLISGITVKCGDETLYEKMFAQGEAAGLANFDIPLDLESKGDAGRTLTVSVTDMASNRSICEYDYYLDSTAPVVCVDGVENGQVREDDAAITLSAFDAGSGQTYIDYTLTRQYDGMVTSENVSTDFIAEGEGTLLTIDEDGYYELSAKAFDMAGNESSEYRCDFTVDKYGPAVEISGVSEGAYVKGEVPVNINVKDGMYENCNVSVTVIRDRNGDRQTLPIESFGMEGPDEQRTVMLKNDGDYEIYVKAEDALGRVSEKAADFRIDSNAPKVSVSGIDEGEVTNNKPVIRINTSETFYESAVVDAVLSRVGDSGDYEKIDEMQYILKGINDSTDITVDEEGIYRLSLKALDRAGNETDYTTNFTVDYTPPVIYGMDKIDGKYLDSFLMPVNIADIIKDAGQYTYESYINDEKIQNGELINEDGKYTLWMSAKDEADNYSEACATFIVDHTAPQIVLKGIKRDGTIRKGSVIDVSLYDEGDVLTSVSFNGKKADISPDGKNAEITVDDYGEYAIDIKAKDSAGNVTDKTIRTSCMLMPNAAASYEKIEKTISRAIEETPEADIDFKGIILGLAAALTGTFGLVVRALTLEDEQLT